MKLSILSVILAISATSVSAAPATSFSGTIYVYTNSVPHPKTTFLKKGSDNHLVTDGIACKGKKTLPGKGDALKGTFTTVNNQWDFNGKHDNEIRMGYVKIDGNKCLSLTKGNALSFENCPSFSKEIKVGNKFAWFHDTRSSAIYAYGGDANAEETNGLTLEAGNLQTNGKTLTGIAFHSNSLENVFIGLGYVGLGDVSIPPTGCQ
ncbi:hypothetical protein NQZ79_g572 [Umbelopsis isabellina]|nr:hypothetical protein NQZ79_g572 [Umbelopsis isabellina]